MDDPMRSASSVGLPIRCEPDQSQQIRLHHDRSGGAGGVAFMT
jgi:hypothetical protein